MILRRNRSTFLISQIFINRVYVASADEESFKQRNQDLDDSAKICSYEQQQCASMGILAGYELLVGVSILCIAACTSIEATSNSATATRTAETTATSTSTSTTTNLNGTSSSNLSFYTNMNRTPASSKLTTRMNLDEFGTLQIYAPNESVPLTINNIDVFQSMSMMIQCMQTPCPPHHYRTGCEELMSPGNCTSCPPCVDQQYRSGCSGASEGLCLNVRTCDPGEFEVRAPTATSDRFCAAPLCSVNEFEILPMTTSTSRQCAVLSECNMTEFEAHAPTATTDRQCSALTTCNVTELEIRAPTPTTNRQCMPCSTTTNLVLDCADASSRAAITSNHICEVSRVDNCCCDEFSSIKRVNGDVNVRSDETMLHFGSIREVGGDINGGGPSSSNRGPLQVVDFGQVTRVGDVELRWNHITQVELGALVHVDGGLSLFSNALTSIDIGAITHIGSLDLYNNDLTSVDFGSVTHIGGNLQLNNNALTSIDFGAITYIVDRLTLSNNALTSVDFGAITQIGWDIWIQNNPSLTSINCRNLGSCLCRSSNTNSTNCPSRCTWSSICI